MRRLWVLILILISLLYHPTLAQDGLNLPTELYILQNDGRIERFGLGAAGVQTISPEGEYIVDFGIAPDGNWFAYRTQSGLSIANMFQSGSDQLIEGEHASAPPIRGRGATIAWSPSADAIAYTTLYGVRVYFRSGSFADITISEIQHLSWSPDGQYLAAESEGDIWWVYRREGVEMVLTSAIPAATDVVWLNETELIFTPPTGGLILMDLLNNNAQRTLLDESLVYRLPFVRLDGSLIVYAMSTESLGRLQEVTIADDGTVNVTDVAQADVDLTDANWSPDGGLLLVFRGGALAISNPITGEGFLLPITGAAAYGWGILYPAQVENFSIPNDGYFLAADDAGIVQVWRIPSTDSRLTILTTASADITEYAISLDGQSVAYVSDGQLWLLRRDSGEEAVPLVETADRTDVQPSFSPDANRIAYRVDNANEAGVRLLTLSGEFPEFLIGDDALVGRVQNPQFASGVNSMTVEVIGDGVPKRIVLVDPLTSELRVLGNYDTSRWLTGTQLLLIGQIPFSEVTDPGLQIFDVNNLEGQPTTVFTLPDGFQVKSIAQPDNQTLHLLLQQFEPGQTQVLRIGINGSDPQIIGNIGFMVDGQLSPDGSVVIGYAMLGGQLLIGNVFTSEKFILGQPLATNAFSWR